jgi:hypothetical protein
LWPFVVGPLDGPEALEQMSEVSRLHQGVLVAGEDGLTLLHPAGR